MINKEQKISKIEDKMSLPGFWDNNEKAQQVIDELNTLKFSVDRVKTLENILEEVEVMMILREEEDDQSLEEDITKILLQAEEKLDSLFLSMLLNQKYDDHNAILALHPGAGGTESQDWVEMLFRMYTRWSEKKGYRVEILDMLMGDEAGLKSVTFSVTGKDVYGYLKSEKGVHRLVRISPFDSSGRRHTSFASVDVMPEVKEESGEVEINQEDLRIETFRAKGAGGQHVNKTDSAVRITHIPTGIVAQCQNERSQHFNREQAMKILRAKLASLYQNEREQQLEEIRGEQKEISWGSQIRSYTFNPYCLVKDHRTNAELGNVQAVMDGEIDFFIDHYLRQKASDRESVK
ncbi:peptide chain release factor 2 [Candidatus Contubernalis alkalaceticus]|nr:peptide chain release factor 2 [Candidatus Contubernalis alkalaceticus]